MHQSVNINSIARKNKIPRTLLGTCNLQDSKIRLKTVLVFLLEAEIGELGSVKMLQ